MQPEEPEISIGVVEDSDEDYAALVRVIGRHPMAIDLERWCRAETLLEACAAQPPRARWPDLLLIDLSLPGISGSDLVAKLRSEIATRPLPLFILSGSLRSRDVDRCYEAGASLYLTKLLSTTHVNAAIELLTASPAWRDRRLHR